MEDKYYTPDIEEFHQWFEYEYKGPEDSEWHKELFKIDGSHPNLKWFRNNDMVRVKYLDQEDIESLGWNLVRKSIDLWFEKEGRFDMGSWTAYKAYLRYGLHDNRMSMGVYDMSDEISTFKGIVKNKSELQRLMKQIGI